VDGKTLKDRDIGFFMGAYAQGNFGMVIIADEPNPLLKDYEVHGIISPTDSSMLLFKAIRQAGAPLESAFKEKIRPGPKPIGNQLTRRQHEVAYLLAKGLSNREIAETTGLKVTAIGAMVSVILRKFNVENRTQVALMLAGNLKSLPPEELSSSEEDPAA
jgi:DNA-binding CsgD family transcriptional regulator